MPLFDQRLAIDGGAVMPLYDVEDVPGQDAAQLSFFVQPLSVDNW